MARSVNEIRDGIAADFMNNADMATAYGFSRGDSFPATFSRVSFENVLFSVLAISAWLLESLFDTHKEEVTVQIEDSIAHRPKWYRDKVLDFMVGKTLIPDTDRYDTTGLTEPDIEAARVVKHAVAAENVNSSILTIKVAGEQDGSRAPLDEQTEQQLLAYIMEVKDAGVRIDLVNMAADTFNCEVDIYYDPMMAPEVVESAARAAIEEYIENLPFNGEYTNMALIDRLQAVEGVRIPELKGSSTSPDGDTSVIDIDARYVPRAGYFTAGTININMKAE